MASYSAVRACVQKMAQQIERVDAHMSMNSEVVEVLGVFEGAWEVGMRYLAPGPVRSALRGFLEAAVRLCGENPALRESLDSLEPAGLWSLAALLCLEAAAEPELYQPLVAMLDPSLSLDRLRALHANMPNAEAAMVAYVLDGERKPEWEEFMHELSG